MGKLPDIENIACKGVKSSAGKNLNSQRKNYFSTYIFVSFQSLIPSELRRFNPGKFRILPFLGDCKGIYMVLGCGGTSSHFPAGTPCNGAHLFVPQLLAVFRAGSNFFALLRGIEIPPLLPCSLSKAICSPSVHLSRCTKASVPSSITSPAWAQPR